MKLILNDPNFIEFKNHFIDLLHESGAIINVDENETLPEWVKSVNYAFDLDRLWSDPKCLRSSCKLIEGILKYYSCSFDLIAGITSNAGAFGTAPLAGALAFELGKPIIIFAETDFGRYYVSPLSLDRTELFQSKKVLLLKDVLVGGSSLTQIGSQIGKNGGSISDLIVFVDFGVSSDLDIPATLSEARRIKLLDASEFNDLLGE